MKIKLDEILRPDNYCAIDASTNSLAFAMFEKGELITYGKIRFAGRNIYEKLGDASRKTKAFFDRLPTDNIVIEHTIYMNSPKTVSDLALVQGALLGAAAQAGVRLAGSINPIAWQTYIGNGKLTTQEKQLIRSDNPGKSASWYKSHERDFRKQKTIRFVNVAYDLNVDDHDIADAIGVGHYAFHNWGKVDK
jgi:Holliday junction resolvasome RuvABC endonuclease subunit